VSPEARELGCKQHSLQQPNSPSLKLRRAKGDDLIRRVVFFKNCKPALTNAVKRVKTIDVDENRIAALKAEAKAIKAELEALAAEAFGVRPQLALAA
jgi:hypothetical protein